MFFTIKKEPHSIKTNEWGRCTMIDTARRIQMASAFRAPRDLICAFLQREIFPSRMIARCLVLGAWHQPLWKFKYVFREPSLSPTV